MNSQPTIAPDFAAVPQYLRDISNWVVYGADKIPYDAKSNGNRTPAKANAPATWTTFETAVAAVDILSGNDYKGPGFELGGTDICGVDFDGCVHDGEPEPFVLAILNLIGGYAEFSPSGRGLHTFFRCDGLPKGQRKFSKNKYGTEIYHGSEPGRYLTVTGQRYGNGEGVPKIENIELVYFLVSQIHNDKLKKLWTGDISEYGEDQSRADLALLDILAHHLKNDAVNIEKYFSASVLGRRDKWTQREDYRRRTIAKAISGKEPTPEDTKTGEPKPTQQMMPVLRDGDKVSLRKINWLWHSRIPFGKIVLFTGNPDNGKSVCAASIAAICTSGGVFPQGDAKVTPFKVLMMVGEDDIDDTVAPRLVAAGADMPKIKFFEGVRLDESVPLGETRGIRLDEHIGVLETILEQNPDIRLVIVDPISNYLGGKSMNGEQDVRGILIPLKQIAARLGVAVILVMHLNKKSDLDAISRVGGAMAFTGVARCSWLFARDESSEDGQLLDTFTMSRIKNNLARADQGGLSFRLEAVPVMTDDGATTAVRTVWGAESKKSADSVLNKSKNPAHRPNKQTSACIDWLFDFLKDGAKRLDEIEPAGKAMYGFSPTTIASARKQGGILTFPSHKEKAKDGKMRDFYSCRLPNTDGESFEFGQRSSTLVGSERVPTSDDRWTKKE